MTTVEITREMCNILQICTYKTLAVYTTPLARAYLKNDDTSIETYLTRLEEPDDEDDEFMSLRILNEEGQEDFWLIKNTYEGSITFLMSEEY